MSALRAYEKIVTTHAETVRYLESLLRAGLFLVPGRFGDSELKSECVYTGISLVSLYHDIIASKNLLLSGTTKTATGEPVPPQYCFGIAKWLSFLQTIELLVEIFAGDRFGEKGKWSSVFVIELAKVILRFKLLFKTNGNIIVHQSVPQRDGSALTRSLVMPTLERKPNDPSDTTRKRTRKTLHDIQDAPIPPPTQSPAPTTTNTTPSSPPNPTPNNLTHDSLVLSLLPPPPPPPAVAFRRLLGDTLYILRPLLYLITMWRFGRKSWVPWILSLSADVTSRLLLGSSKLLNSNEQDEVRRRTALWLYYLVRSPMFETLAGHKRMSSFLNVLQKIPAVGLLSAPLLEYLAVYRAHYFYTSAS